MVSVHPSNGPGAFWTGSSSRPPVLLCVGNGATAASSSGTIDAAAYPSAGGPVRAVVAPRTPSTRAHAFPRPTVSPHRAPRGGRTSCRRSIRDPPRGARALCSVTYVIGNVVPHHAAPCRNAVYAPLARRQTTGGKQGAREQMAQVDRAMTPAYRAHLERQARLTSAAARRRAHDEELVARITGTEPACGVCGERFASPAAKVLHLAERHAEASR